MKDTRRRKERRRRNRKWRDVEENDQSSSVQASEGRRKLQKKRAEQRRTEDRRILFGGPFPPPLRGLRHFLQRCLRRPPTERKQREEQERERHHQNRRPRRSVRLLRDEMLVSPQGERQSEGKKEKISMHVHWRREQTHRDSQLVENPRFVPPFSCERGRERRQTSERKKHTQEHQDAHGSRKSPGGSFSRTTESIEKGIERADTHSGVVERKRKREERTWT